MGHLIASSSFEPGGAHPVFAFYSTRRQVHHDIKIRNRSSQTISAAASCVPLKYSKYTPNETSSYNNIIIRDHRLWRAATAAAAGHVYSLAHNKNQQQAKEEKTGTGQCGNINDDVTSCHQLPQAITL